MKYEKIKRLNIGSGRKKIEGYANIDGLDWNGNTDILQDLTDVPYPIKSEQIEKITCGDTLEHIPFGLVPLVLNEFCRLLKKGGELSIQVPDCGKMMEYYVNGEVCRCVNHKDIGDGFKSDPNCRECEGKAIVSKTRFEIAFTGAQKHKYDAHLTMFTKEIMEDYLREARFQKIKFKDDIYKIKVSCIK